MNLSLKIHQESSFEHYLSTALADLGTNSSWQVSLNDEGFDPHTALYFPDFIQFLEDTAPGKLEKMKQSFKDNWQSNLQLSLVNSLETEGTIGTLRNGFPMAGYQTIQCSAPFPDDPRIKDAIQNYNANILRVMHQVHYQTQGNKSLDLVFFINGIPVATAEIKTELTQTVHDAIEEYQFERRPIEPGTKRRNYLLMYKRGAVVHFAISENEVWMCTNLEPDKPRFLPFNQGTIDGHAGNPTPIDEEYPTSYFWNQICQRDNWLHIFQSFVFEEISNKEDATGRIRKSCTQIFPRYHQWDAVTRMIADTKEKGVGGKYLIEHSAGSGKTETITWTAHELANIRDKKGQRLFSSVIVVTDRLSLDTNIKKTIGQLKRVPGYVMDIGTDADGNRTSDKAKSKQLATALGEKREIIVVTLQTFLYAWPTIAADERLTGANFAVIIDEAHSSQEGSNAAALKSAFAVAADKLKLAKAKDFAVDTKDGEDFTDEDIVSEYFSKMQSLNKMPKNVSFYAFTATPKAETRILFGTPTGQKDSKGNEIKRSFHLYPMRQAIEEGFIIDPLSGYIPYSTAYKLAEQFVADKPVDELAARRVIAKWKSLHPTNVMEKTAFIIEHFVKNVSMLLDGQAKAMIITSSRPAVVRYKYAFDAYLKAHPEYDRSKIAPHLQFKVPGEPLVAFSDKVNGSKCVFPDDVYLKDNPFASIKTDYDYTESNMNNLGYQTIENAFDTPKYRLLIVANKFQTGFDQPKLCALYIDKAISNDIEIVQTYSRVNRIYPGKDQVFIVDFVNKPETVLGAFKKYDTGAKMTEGQDPNIVYKIKQRLDATNIYSQQEFNHFRDAQYKAIVALTQDPQQDNYRKQLYQAVNGPAEKWNELYKSYTSSYATWMNYFTKAKADNDLESQKYAEQKMQEAQEKRDQLVNFRRDLKLFGSAYMFISQIIDLGEPDFEVFNSFTKLLFHRISNTSLEEIDVKSLVLSDYKINKLKLPTKNEDRTLKPMGEGTGKSKASKRESLRKIVEKLNETWGNNVNVVAAARAVNFIADYVEADTITQTRIVNSSNSKASILADGRLKSIIKASLVSMITNSLGELAAQVINDPQAIDSLADQVYDQVASGKRYSIPELQTFISEKSQDYARYH